MIKVLTREEFDRLYSILAIKKNLNKEYIYDIYLLVMEGINDIKNNQSGFDNLSLNPVDIILYIVGEYSYSISSRNEQEIIEFDANEDIKGQMANVVMDKYLSLSMFNYSESKFVDKYFPPISSIGIYLNFMINIVNSYEKNSPESTLISDLLQKSLSISRCIISLLKEGYYTEAFASWRTLHECECTLLLLDKYQGPAINAYLKHMQYGVAYKNGLGDKEATDKVFETMKSEMKSYDLKSKDMKKYIEYGWMTAIPEFNLADYKFNFRDGLERLAGLENYSERYMTSSEILHSTPILIYSSQEYFYFITLLSLYESFFRLESVFDKFISMRVSPSSLNQYHELRNIYYSQLVNIHKREATNFMAWQNSKATKNNSNI